EPTRKLLVPAAGEVGFVQLTAGVDDPHPRQVDGLVALRLIRHRRTLPDVIGYRRHPAGTAPIVQETEICIAPGRSSGALLAHPRGAALWRAPIPDRAHARWPVSDPRVALVKAPIARGGRRDCVERAERVERVERVERSSRRQLPPWAGRRGRVPD